MGDRKDGRVRVMGNRLYICASAVEPSTMTNAGVSWCYSQAMRYDVPVSSIKSRVDLGTEEKEIRSLAKRHTGTLKALSE